MIRILIVAMFACLVASPAHAGGAAKLDSENGYRGLHFGEPSGSVPDLELLSRGSVSGTRTYSRRSEPLDFGDATLDAVTYGFFEDELYFIALFTSGRGNSLKVLARLEDRYGRGTPVLSEAKEYVWQGRDVTLHYREDPATHMGMISYTSHTHAAMIRARMRALATRETR